MVHVALRKSEVNKSLNEHQYYDENFKLMPGKIMEKEIKVKIQFRGPIAGKK